MLYVLSDLDKKYYSVEICETCVRKNIHTMHMFKDIKLSEDLYKEVLAKDGEFIKNIKREYQTDLMKKIAIHNKLFAIKFIEDQTEEICRIVVEKSHSAYILGFINNWTTELVIMASSKHVEFFKYVDTIFNINIYLTSCIINPKLINHISDNGIKKQCEHLLEQVLGKTLYDKAIKITHTSHHNHYTTHYYDKQNSASDKKYYELYGDYEW